MRGKVFVVENLFVFYRITPAYAGKSLFGDDSEESQKDHPRLCGEKAFLSSKWKPSVRITPAYAGKSSIVGMHIAEL